jgi:hypothetical protein
MYFPTLTNAHLVNNRSLSADIRLFGGKVIFSFMVDPSGNMFYKHLMVNVAGHEFETIPVFG